MADGFVDRVEVTLGGQKYSIANWSTKTTFWREFGIVFAGEPFDFVVPPNDIMEAGVILDGYTKHPTIGAAYELLQAAKRAYVEGRPMPKSIV